MASRPAAASTGSNNPVEGAMAHVKQAISDLLSFEVLVGFKLTSDQISTMVTT